ncbi:hypothetical protein CLOM_g9017 [Closterium sp. NIES-68]|nr:hypothetical protein CLOM_g9017 [Closterium sp. NIES-68]
MAPCRGFMHRRRDWERSLISRRAWCSGTVALLALIAALSATSPASAQYLFPAIPAPPPPNASASASSFQNAERNTRADSNGAGTNEDALAVVTIAGPRLREVPGRQQVKPASLSAATSAATATATAAAATVATDSSGLPRRSREELYIVYFRDVPSVVDYKGGIPGLAATAAPATDDGLTAAAAAAATAGTDDAGAVTATAATAGSDDIGATDDADDGDGMEAGYDADATGAAYATDGGTDAVGAARGSASVSASVAPAAAGGTRGASGARGIGRGRGRAAAAAAAVQAMRVLDGPRGRGRVDARDGNVRAFAQFLTGVQQHMLQTVGIPKGRIVHSYRYVLNAVSVRLTRLEARRVKRHVSVLKVERCQTVTVQTIHTPQFLQLPWRVWPSLGGRSKAGNGMIIGVVDTGIWPEHPSFSDKGYSPVPARWRGTCTTTSDFKSCSRKIIGARYFVEGLLASDGVLDPSVEYLSPRDASDHGTWCAGAAAGNPVKVSGGGTAQYGTASGMAPRARIAVYKAIWMQGKLAVGSDSDVFAAVDRAVADGVDVLSMSVAINEETYFKHLAMLRAARAGVFVSLVAGNSGPPPGSRAAYRTLTNLSPYYITVAASTSNQVWPPLAKLALGNRQSYAGQTLLGGDASTRRLPLVDAKTAAASGFTPSQAEACIPYSLSPSKVRGKIVVCCTGFSYASEKAVEVARAGGRALIIVPYSLGRAPSKPPPWDCRGCSLSSGRARQSGSTFAARPTL